MTDDFMDRYDESTWGKVMDLRLFPAVFAAIQQRDFEQADRTVNDAVRRWNANLENKTNVTNSNKSL